MYLPSDKSPHHLNLDEALGGGWLFFPVVYKGGSDSFKNRDFRSPGLALNSLSLSLSKLTH